MPVSEKIETLANSTTPKRRRDGRWRIFFLAWSIVSVLMASWALMVPLSASMDEPAHIVKAASVVRGQFVGEPGTAGHIVQVPRYIALSQEITCTAFQEDRSAQCQDLDGANDSTIVDSTTTAGQYNPIYYAIVGLPSLVFNDISGIYAMRIVSAILTSFFIAAAVAMAWSWRPRAYAAIGVALGLTPSMLFLGGALNPNAVETSATLAVFVAMLSIVLQRKTHIPLLAERCVVIVLAAAIGETPEASPPCGWRSHCSFRCVWHHGVKFGLSSSAKPWS